MEDPGTGYGGGEESRDATDRHPQDDSAGITPEPRQRTPPSRRPGRVVCVVQWVPIAASRASHVSPTLAGFAQQDGGRTSTRFAYAFSFRFWVLSPSTCLSASVTTPPGGAFVFLLDEAPISQQWLAARFHPSADVAHSSSGP